jgi:hypothetical protein
MGSVVLRMLSSAKELITGMSWWGCQGYLSMTEAVCLGCLSRPRKRQLMEKVKTGSTRQWGDWHAVFTFGSGLHMYFISFV